MSTMTGKKKSSRKIGTVLIIFSTFLFFWLLWPFSQKTQEILFQSGELAFTKSINADDASDQGDAVLAIPERIHIILSWMPVIRKGRLDTIQFQLIQDERITDGTGLVDSDTSSAQAETLNIFGEYSIMAKARLDMVNVTMDPPGESGMVLSEGSNVSFNWEISPEKVDHLQGIVWFYLVAFSNDGDEVIKKAVSAQHLDINVISILGIDVVYLWIIALISTICGALLYLGLFDLNFRNISYGRKRTRS